MYQEISAAELAGMLGTDDEPYLLDVRESDEVAAWAFPGAVNIPLGEIAERLGEVPADRPVVVLCASGSRSLPAAAALARTGREAANLTGGMMAWGQVYDIAVLEVEGASVLQVRRRAKGCLSYVVGSGDEAFVVDPSVDIGVYLQIAEERGWRVSRVFDTHLHADHLSGARDLAAAADAVLHLNPADTFEFDFAPLRDGDRFGLPGGAEVSVAAFHTPGHTEGSTVFFVEKAVLSGDTLFVDGVGRPDLAERAEEFARNLHKSLHDKVLSLPDDVTVLPAHYGESVKVRPGEPVGATLGTLRENVEPLRLDEEAFVAWAVARTTPRPPNYVPIIVANMGRAGAPVSALQHLEVGPNRCSA